VVLGLAARGESPIGLLQPWRAAKKRVRPLLLREEKRGLTPFSDLRHGLLGAAAVVAGTVLVGSGQTPGQTSPSLPGAPMANKGTMVTPRLEGWFRNPDGTATILMGYFNRNQSPVDIPIGPNNKIDPSGPDQGQPTRFLPGRQWGMFSITVPKDFGTKKFTWTIAAYNQPATITLWTNPPYLVSPFISEFSGNTPPKFRLDQAGPELTGPPRGIGKTYAAAVGQPLTLTVWAKDVGPTIIPGRSGGPEPGRGGPPAAAGRGAAGPGPGFAVVAPPAVVPAVPTGLRMSWAMYRGPADVKFSTERPTIDAAADGKAETTVTFGTPGEYWLRAQFNDNSGDGGGGDQCCWSSAIVRVNVK
jgi:hypothetical protein